MHPTRGMKGALGWKQRRAVLLHQSARARLRLDQLAAALRPSAPRRVISTACWRFPIYSQTFVYQELTQLIRRGYNLKFLYAERERADRLPAQFAPLWRGRRRMFLSEHVYDADYEHYRGRMPERVDTMTRMLCDASGLPADRLRKHIHFRQGFSFARVVEAFRPSYLHSYFFYEGTLFTFMASHLLGIPRGVSCYADHTLSDYDLKVVPLHLRDCDLIVATSHRIKRELVGLAPSMNPDRVVVKPNAINTNQFPLTSHLEPPPGEPHRLVCVSRYDPKKGLIFLVRALALLRQRGCNVEVHHVGGVDHDQKSSTEYARHLECEIRDLQLDDYVHLEGHRPESEVNAMLGRAHLFVAPFIEMPSGDKDGIPTTLLEAMSAGLPVVATDAGSITEVIDADRDGIIVRQRDPTALADAIAALLGDAPRRAQLARCAAEKVRAQFDVTVCEHVFHDALEALLSGRVVSFQA